MATTELRRVTRAFEQAVDMAAQGSGNVNERLVLAYQRYLVALPPDAFPAALRARFLRLHEQVCDWPPGDPARLQPTLQGALS